MITFDDFEVGAITEFGDYLVTEEEIIEFAQKYDPQPFHLDPELAAKTPFGDLISSGWMTCSIFMRMLCDNVLNGSTSIGSPGVDELRWKRPVFAGDRLRVRSEVKEARQSRKRPEMGTTRNYVEVYNQKNEVVMSMTTNGMFLTREGLKNSPMKDYL